MENNMECNVYYRLSVHEDVTMNFWTLITYYERPLFTCIMTTLGSSMRAIWKPNYWSRYLSPSCLIYCMYYTSPQFETNAMLVFPARFSFMNHPVIWNMDPGNRELIISLRTNSTENIRIIESVNYRDLLWMLLVSSLMWLIIRDLLHSCWKPESRQTANDLVLNQEPDTPLTSSHLECTSRLAPQTTNPRSHAGQLP